MLDQVIKLSRLGNLQVRVSIKRCKVYIFGPLWIIMLFQFKIKVSKPFQNGACMFGDF